MNFLAISTTEFTVEVILQISKAMETPEFKLPEDILISIKKFLENVETAIAYSLRCKNIKLNFINVAYTEIFPRCIYRLDYRVEEGKVEVTRNLISPLFVEKHQCWVYRPELSGPACNKSYVTLTKPRKVPIRSLPKLLNTPFKGFAKAKLQGLL